jgi:hypothetical protein
LRKWTKNDKSVTNIDALPEFVDFAHEAGKNAIERDRILRLVGHNFDKYLKGGNDVNLTTKLNVQLIDFFRKELDDNIKAFRFSLNDIGLFTPFPIHSFILFAIQIRSLFATVRQLPRGELLYSLAQIFTGCIPHREENDYYKEHTAGKLPYNHIFFELVVVACGSMIDTFYQLGYLIISKHKTGAMEIRVHPDFKDADELMIIPTQDVLEGIFHPDSTTIHPDLAVSECTKAVSLLQPKLQPPSKRTRPKTKPLPTIGLTKTESTVRLKRLKRRKIIIKPNYRDKDDDNEGDENDDEEYDEGKRKDNHTVINSDNSLPTIGLTKTESTVRSKRSKRRKTKNKPDYQDKDDDDEEDEDDDEEYDECGRENNHPGINHDKSKGSSTYKDTSFWPDKGGYNLEEWEFKEKEKWATPAACMDNSQRKTLGKSIWTWQKCASRYSQRPGQNWPAQEWVLLQITDIDGVGQKKASSRCKKTAVMAYGQSQAIKLYQKWVDINGDTGNGARDFVGHSTSNIDTLKSF